MAGGRWPRPAFDGTRRLDAGSWFAPRFAGAHVPSFREALELVRDLGLGANIEIKPCPGREVETAERAVALIEEQWPARRPPPLISSFKPASFAAVKAKAPALPRGLLLYEDGLPTWKRDARDLACATVHCSEHNMTAAWAAEIRGLGYGLAVYTVNEPARARELMAFGVQCIISDAPDRVLAAV